jgi:hypothetical protein
LEPKVAPKVAPKAKAAATAIVKSEWKSTLPNPEEELLKGLFRAEVANLDKDFSKERAQAEIDLEDIQPLFRASGLEQSELGRMLEEDATRATDAFKSAEPRLLEPSLDIEKLHQKDLASAKEHERLLGTMKATVTEGYIWNSAYGGGWWSWNGEAEEVPAVSFDVPADRFDPRAQAYGEGWYDGDFSLMNAYLAFQFTPSTWGTLDIWVNPWVHGFFQLYANDKWYKSEKATADLDTWVDVHQGYWRSRQQVDRWRISGDELHPERHGRIDTQFSHHYTTTVGGGDRVTVRVGVQLYCYGKANGGRAKLDFRNGSSNYVYVPYVHWHLTH